MITNNKLNLYCIKFKVQAIIAKERSKAIIPTNIAPAAQLINSIDPVNGLTSPDYVFAGWGLGHDFE